MSTLYGIEQSTDMRSPNTVIRRFTSTKALKNWLLGGGGFTYADPDAARNHHRSFRTAYEFFGRIDKKHHFFNDSGTRDYPRRYADNLALYISEYGHEIEIDNGIMLNRKPKSVARR